MADNSQTPDWGNALRFSYISCSGARLPLLLAFFALISLFWLAVGFLVLTREEQPWVAAIIFPVALTMFSVLVYLTGSFLSGGVYLLPQAGAIHVGISRWRRLPEEGRTVPMLTGSSLFLCARKTPNVTKDINEMGRSFYKQELLLCLRYGEDIHLLLATCSSPPATRGRCVSWRPCCSASTPPCRWSKASPPSTSTP